jgi:hypothetical protein
MAGGRGGKTEKEIGNMKNILKQMMMMNNLSCYR